MQTLYHLYLLFGLPAILLADTNITSEVTGHVTLTVDRSPYVASEGLNIQEGSMLEVEAGVIVKFAPGRGVDIHGNLLLQSTENNKITFTLWPDAEIDLTLTNRSGSIRLTGNVEDKGLLEVKIGNSWQTLCDSRLSNLNIYKNWMKTMSMVSTTVNSITK